MVCENPKRGKSQKASRLPCRLLLKGTTFVLHCAICRKLLTTVLLHFQLTSVKDISNDRHSSTRCDYTPHYREAEKTLILRPSRPRNTMVKSREYMRRRMMKILAGIIMWGDSSRGPLVFPEFTSACILCVLPHLVCSVSGPSWIFCYAFYQLLCA